MSYGGVNAMRREHSGQRPLLVLPIVSDVVRNHAENAGGWPAKRTSGAT